jgi:magnesium chelatase subunit I
MKGADYVSRELIRNAVAKTYDQYFAGANMQQVIQWFDLGGEIQIAESAGAADLLQILRGIQGLMDKLTRVNVGPKDNAESQVSAAEFILEGLYALKRIGRNEERVFTAGEKQPRASEKPYEREELPFSRTRRPLN